MSAWQRRRWLLEATQAMGRIGVARALCQLPRALALAALPAHARAQRHPAAVELPRDHGAHLQARTEWWYATGWLGRGEGAAAVPTHGFQLTFFRSRTGLAEALPSRFAARQLLFAHAALTELGEPGGQGATAQGRRHLHDQRLLRWSGDTEDVLAHATVAGADLRIKDWTLRNEAAGWRTRIEASGFAFELLLARTQPALLQGPGGISRKGPDDDQFSHYYSEPQLVVSGSVTMAGGSPPGQTVRGRAWLDHEWSDQYLPAGAVGWDWIGIDLFDGSALMAFVMRRADGSALWAGGSFRRATGTVLEFSPGDLRFTPGRRWLSPASGARYPVQWQLQTPAGRFELNALLDAQELDSRTGTGTIYWEGLSELRDGQGRRVGLGYLEMTGYAQPLHL